MSTFFRSIFLTAFEFSVLNCATVSTARADKTPAKTRVKNRSRGLEVESGSRRVSRLGVRQMDKLVRSGRKIARKRKWLFIRVFTKWVCFVKLSLGNDFKTIR